MSDDLRTQALKWFVETGYVDVGGIGLWDETKESVEVNSEASAEALRDEWLDQGKLVKTHWGELRPTFPYGIFRIRSIWVDVPNPLADRITTLEASLKAAEAERDAAVAAALREAARAASLASERTKTLCSLNDDDYSRGVREGIVEAQEEARRAILALITPDASAALDRVKAEAESRGMERAAEIAGAMSVPFADTQNASVGFPPVGQQIAAVIRARAGKGET